MNATWTAIEPTATPQFPAQSTATPPTSPSSLDAAPFSSEDVITLGKEACSAVAGSAVASTIDTVGMAASAVFYTPKALVRGYQVLHHAHMGLAKKAFFGVGLPIWAATVPILVACGASGRGLGKGFKQGENGQGMAAIAQDAVNDVKRFNQDAPGLMPDLLLATSGLWDAAYPKDAAQPSM